MFLVVPDSRLLVLHPPSLQQHQPQQQMSFYALSCSTSFLTLGLATALHVAPELLWSELLLPAYHTPAVYYGGRRYACFFLSLSTLSWTLRNLDASSTVRRGYCRAVAVFFVAVAIVGGIEGLQAALAPVGIWRAIVTELVFGAWFLYYGFQEEESLVSSADDKKQS